MTHSLSDDEKRIAEDQSPLCDGFVETGDLILSYPIELMKKSRAHTVADTLQRAMDCLKSVTNLNPTQEFHSRAIIRWIKNRDLEGKARWKSEKDANGKLIGHRINLSWDYMSKPFEPFRVCAHELVHAFYRISPLHERNEECVGNEDWLGNEGWGEGFCDFMRGPVMNCMRLPEQQGIKVWQDRIRDKRMEKNDKGGNAAGQFVIWYLTEFCEADENSIAEYIDNKELIKKFVSYLFDNFACRPLKSKLRPTKKMKDKYGSEKL